MRFGHVGLCTRDWRRLATFYGEVFGMAPAGPERDLAGPWLDRGTGLREVRIRGVHLRLPGGGADGPTLELFHYEPAVPAGTPMPNRPGLGHLCFQVDDVASVLARVTAAGGERFGEPTTGEVPAAGTLDFVYCRDPEGNILELQRWHPPAE